MNKIRQNLYNALNSMSIKQFITMCFLLALVICSSLLASWQIKWLNQASQTKLLSAQREMALDIARFIETNAQSVKNILENPEQYPSIIESQIKIAISSQGNQVINNDELFDFQSNPNWQTVIETLPTVNDNDYRFAEDLLERNLPDQIFFKLDQNDNNQINTNSVKNNDSNSETPISATLYQINLSALSMLFFKNFESTSYEYRLIFQDKIMAQNSDIQTDKISDISIPVNMYFKDSKRLRFKSRNNFKNNSEQSGRINFYWIYETLLRQFSFNENDSSPFNGRVNDFKLEVFNLDESIKQSIRNQKIILMVFSIAIVILLTATAFFLVYAISRSQKQRKLEQEFIATVSHELRTPLTVIQSAADNLSEGFVSKPESIVRYGDEIKNQSLRLNRMIESTLMYSGMPNQSIAKQDNIETYEFLNEIISPLSQLASNQNIELTPEYSGLPVKFITDANALRMIIENLIMNSIIHGQSKIERSKIELKLSAQNNLLRIVISDNGEGIAKREQKRIFKAFVRGKTSEQQQHPGSGLGLNLIKRMVSILNGKLELQSPYVNLEGQKQNGTQFLIELPIKQEQIHD